MTISNIFNPQVIRPVQFSQGFFRNSNPLTELHIVAISPFSARKTNPMEVTRLELWIVNRIDGRFYGCSPETQCTSFDLRYRCTRFIWILDPFAVRIS